MKRGRRPVGLVLVVFPVTRPLNPGFTLVELPVVSKGFTIVELLVVITIIMVLLAMLMPSMERAIYQAELAVCGSNLKSIAAGAVTYALDHRRHYPMRHGVQTTLIGWDSWEPDYLQMNGRDDRRIIRGYVDLTGHLNCPLTRRVDIAGTRDDAWLLGAYALWYGWRYTASPIGAQPGLMKIGDRLGWADSSGAYRFNVLATDHDLIIERDQWGHGSHPEASGLWNNVWAENTPVAPDAFPAALGGSDDSFITFTYWYGVPGGGNHRRGPIDMNVSLQDGSVERVERVAWDANRTDERVAGVPFRANYVEADTLWFNLPKR